MSVGRLGRLDLCSSPSPTSEFMRQLAQLKEDHVANLRVIERMYNEGQGGGGSALPDYDDGGASVLHRRVVRAVVPRHSHACLLYTSPSPRDGLLSRMPSSA